MAVGEPAVGEEWAFAGDGGQTSDAVREAACRWVLWFELVSNRRGEQKRPHQLQVMGSVLVEKLC